MLLPLGLQTAVFCEAETLRARNGGGEKRQEGQGQCLPRHDVRGRPVATRRDRMEQLKVHSFMQQSGLSGVSGQCTESRIGETLEALVFFSLPRSDNLELSFAGSGCPIGPPGGNARFGILPGRHGAGQGKCEFRCSVARIGESMDPEMDPASQM